MKIIVKNTVIGVVCLILTASVCCLAKAEAAATMLQSGSYEFKHVSVAEALRTIDRDTGITINAPFDQLQEIVQKSYENVSVDEIIRSLIQRHDHSIVWHYRDRKIVAVDIRIEEAQSGQSVSGTASRKEGLSRLKPESRARSHPARRYNPSAGNRSEFPPAPDQERYPGVQTPPMPPGM